MSLKIEKDEVSGTNTTGHEWNGIKELDTAIPIGVVIFLIATHIFAVIWWVLMPTWPLGTTFTKGVLDTNQRKMVAEELALATAARAPWMNEIDKKSFAEIQADPKLMEIVKRTGPQLFGDNCAACHGHNAKGSPNYPNLTDAAWLWGGGPEKIAETIRVGINSTNPNTHVSQMPAFGKDGIITAAQVKSVASYVYSLSHADYSKPDNAARIKEGQELFTANCASCHGDKAEGNPEMGAPNLTDQSWIYGGKLATIETTIEDGRQGHMPTWEKRLSPADIKILALYVNSLGTNSH